MSIHGSSDAPPAGFKVVKPVEYQIRLDYTRGATGLKIMTMDEDIKIYIGRLYDRTEVQYDNMIKFDNQIVSRNHAHLAIKGAARTLCIKDAGSSHGTFLNKVRLSNTGEESNWTELSNGDKLSLGSDQVVDGEMIKCVQIDFEISRFEGKETKIFLEGDEEDAPLSPVVSAKEFKNFGKKKPPVNAKQSASQGPANGSSSSGLPEITGTSAASSIRDSSVATGPGVTGLKSPVKKMSLLSPFQMFSSKNTSVSDKRGSLFASGGASGNNITCSTDGIQKLSINSLNKGNNSASNSVIIPRIPSRTGSSTGDVPSNEGSTQGYVNVAVLPVASPTTTGATAKKP